MKVFKLFIAGLAALYVLTSLSRLWEMPGLLHNAKVSGGDPLYLYGTIAWTLISGLACAAIAFALVRNVRKKSDEKSG
jgi:predicted Co/Zn/Cd cation transporter (cation efflux family)